MNMEIKGSFFRRLFGLQALWRSPQSFSVQKATEISPGGPAGSAMAAHNWTKVATQTWEHVTWDGMTVTMPQAPKKKGAKNKRSTNTDFYIGCFQSTSSHINTNFEWCCDCVFKSISWPKNLVSDAAKQCNKSTWMNCLLEGSQIQNILIYSWTTCVVFMRFFCFQKGVLLRHRPSSLGPRWREGHNLEPLRGKQRHHAFFSTEPQQQSSMEHEGCWLPGILTMALL